MPITFETLPNGARKARKKYRRDGVLGELEIPSGTTPDQNAWLTLTLHYTLTFLDSKKPNPPKNDGVVQDIVTNAGGDWYARDAGGFMFRIRDWDAKSKDTFSTMFDAGWLIWNHRFMIMTPKDFDQFDYRSRDKIIRPNVLCLFRMQRADDKPGARNFNIVRLEPTTDRILSEDGSKSKAFDDGFKPNDVTMADDAWLRPVLGHELGHVLGLSHILALEGEPACRNNPNQDRCYGVTPEEIRNIMGKGRKVTLINARPWRDHLCGITDTHREFWNFVLLADPDQQDLAPRLVRTSPGKKT